MDKDTRRAMDACSKYLPDDEHDHLLETIGKMVAGAQKLGIIIGIVIGFAGGCATIGILTWLT